MGGDDSKAAIAAAAGRWRTRVQEWGMNPTPVEAYQGLEPREVWRHFGALNGIPRPSGKEAAARDYALGVAVSRGAEGAVDARGNLVVRVPATPGCDRPAATAVQAHLDMVCENRPDVAHDWDRDPVRPRVVGDAVFATGTTLGADNGVGAACALALLTAPDLKHGPLELVFTVEEETGLHGAAALDPALVRARTLINLDSEDPRELTVGCAGGAGTILRLAPETAPVPAGWLAREVAVSGLKGGHSGVQIQEPLANAIKLVTAVLHAAHQGGAEFRLASIRGGNAHNAIPRDAAAYVFVEPGELSALESAVERTGEELRAEWGAHEPGLTVEVRDASPPTSEALTSGDGDGLLSLLRALPHGVLRMSQVFPGKVETSANLAQIGATETGVEISTSSRSFVPAELERVQAQIRALGEAAGADVRVRDGYPGWEPDRSSELLRRTKAVYRQEFGREAEVQVIHAGLECGVIVSRLPGMEAISFGPRILGAHTPEEHVLIPTVGDTWRLLVALLADLA